MAAAPRPVSVLPPGLPPSAAPTRGARRRGQVALCARLALRGPLAWISVAIAGVTVFGAVVVTLTVAHEGPNAPLTALPSLTAGALAWGAGVLLAFASGAHALQRDVTEGIRALLVARGGSLRAYAFARVGGLAAVLAAILGGGTAVAGVVATLAASKLGLAAATLQATVGSVAYGFAFAAVIAPIAVAALGARSRSGGYGWLLVVLVMPELFSRWTARALPHAWRELVSVPSALAALRASLLPPGIDVARFARAAIVLVIVFVVAMLVVHREVARVGNERQPRP